MTPATGHPATRPDAAPLPARTGPARRPGPATRQTSLILGPVTTAPATARGVLTTALIVWGLAHLKDDAALITSELVTNAITASTTKAPPGREPLPVTLWIAARAHELIIRVWDPDPTPPPPNQETPDDTTENGRGLLIVSALSQRWGTHPAPNGGKYVWASLPLSPTHTTNSFPRGEPGPTPAARENRGGGAGTLTGAYNSQPAQGPPPHEPPKVG